MNEYAYVEEIDEDHVRVWPLTDSELTWNGEKVLTRKDGFTLEIEMCLGYEKGNPGYYVVETDELPEVCMLESPISGTSVGSKRSKTWRKELWIPEGSGGLEGALRDKAYSHDFDLLEVEPKRLCWGGEGLGRWIETAKEEVERKAARKKAGETREKLKEFHDGGNAFINPYTFVPLPDTVKRDKPHGHARAVEGGLTGYLDVEFAFRSPLMMPVDWNIPEETTVTGTRIEERVTVPGSSVRGAVRSLFEVISSSCLSILDPDYRPAHRASLEMRPDKRLAVVDEVDSDGRVISVLPTNRVVWIRAEALWHLFDGAAGLRSGVRISFDESAIYERSFGGNKGKPVKREQLKPEGEATLTEGGDWVVHVADAGTKGDHPADHIYVAVGKLETTPIRLGEMTWENYRELCRYSVDVTGGGLAPSAPAWDAEEWAGVAVMVRHTDRNGGHVVTAIGKRRKSDGALAPGDSVWITTGSEGGERVVTGLTMSSSWRELGKGPIRDRLPDESLLPCRDPDELCPACATFGFIEARAEGQRRDQAEHNAYASHLRFGAFETDAPVPLRLVLPPPTRSPRPSAGAFYLEHLKVEGDNREAGVAEFGKPASRWGGRLDSPRMRRIAGRKFYWHGQEPEDTTPTPRQVRRNHYPAEGANNCREVRRWITEKPPVLRGRIHFENIDARQLGLLMLALEPRELAKRAGITVNGELATHLGGGKGLGFGTAVGRITATCVQDAAGRYRAGAGKVEVDPWGAAMQVIDPEALWITGLVKALGTGSVPTDRIWYPTMGNFTQRGSYAQQQRFDKSFEYYAKFSGGKNKEIRMRTLPRIDDPIQYMSNEN
ncbi:TIGR03986 family type III CRISPR-associated RAMP protein [Arachnia propionica]|uniref:TIGR03986 family type III CRISPR-associated RAMP protein n=1 Tax=Arachnia propionica TaxID=1750 RepID=UPI000F6F03B7|nr:TIGR03986 family CRISPR-associated RAMP protein [Arachnia propionica]VEJ57494.1 CRISPR-associated protein [Arachnia propionica]